MKKLLIIIILLVTAAVGFYFGYWTNTPAYAAGEIQQAVQKKDLQHPAYGIEIPGKRSPGFIPHG